MLPEIDDAYAAHALMHAKDAIAALRKEPRDTQSSAFDVVPGLASIYRSLIHIRASGCGHRAVSPAGELEVAILNGLTPGELEQLCAEVEGHGGKLHVGT